jgi:hypothetical protein
MVAFNVTTEDTPVKRREEADSAGTLMQVIINHRTALHFD